MDHSRPFSRQDEAQLLDLRDRQTPLTDVETRELDALVARYDAFINEGMSVLGRLAGSDENTMSGKFAVSSGWFTRRSASNVFRLTLRALLIAACLLIVGALSNAISSASVVPPELGLCHVVQAALGIAFCFVYSPSSFRGARAWRSSFIVVLLAALTGFNICRIVVLARRDPRTAGRLTAAPTWMLLQCDVVFLCVFLGICDNGSRRDTYRGEVG